MTPTPPYDDDGDDSSLRTFTASRLDASGPAVAWNTKIKVEASSSVKVETLEPGKNGGAGGSTGNSAATAEKEEAVKSVVFAENVQNSGAYIAN